MTGLKVTYTGKASVGWAQTLSVYNWRTGAWTPLDARTIGTTELATTAVVGGTLADYVSGTAGDGEVRVGVRCTRADSKAFYTCGDLLKPTFTK